jgi:hypothetical protein
MEREKEKDKLLKEIQKKALRLMKLNYMFTDRYSSIVLFDDLKVTDEMVMKEDDRSIQDAICGSLYP